MCNKNNTKMKAKRVDCTYCLHFVADIHEDENDLFSKIKEKAKCKLGKRVMFRFSKRVMFRFSRNGMIDFRNVGYIRYCEHYELNEKNV